MRFKPIDLMYHVPTRNTTPSFTYLAKQDLRLSINILCIRNYGSIE